MEITHCKNCGEPKNTNFCIDCGYPINPKRIDWKYIKNEIGYFFNFEKGILYTTRKVLLKPQQSIKEFISGNRYKLIRPIYFIILTSLIYTLANQFLHFEEAHLSTFYSEVSEVKVDNVILVWIREHYAFSIIIATFFIGFWLRLFFKKSGYNFFEILVLLCYVCGIGMLISTLMGITQTLTGLNLMSYTGIVATLYSTWAIGRFFGNKVMNYVKAFASYVLGGWIFGYSVYFLAILVDWMIARG